MKGADWVERRGGDLSAGVSRRGTAAPTTPQRCARHAGVAGDAQTVEAIALAALIAAGAPGLVQNWGCQCVPDIFAPVVGPGGRGVRWILKLAVAGDEGACVDIMEISKPDDLNDIANLGLTLTEAKQLLARVQREISTAQARAHAVGRPVSPCGDGVCRVKDYRDHAVATLFGQVTLRVPRFRCGACGLIEKGTIGRRIVARHRNWTGFGHTCPL